MANPDSTVNADKNASVPFTGSCDNRASMPVVPLLLVGAGHAHLVAMRLWADRGWHAPAGSVLVTPEPVAWYSGMMPGLMAGRFSVDQCAIDLEPVCQATGLELVVGSVQGLDADQRIVELSDGRRLGFDVLSVNTGSSPPAPLTDGSVPVVAAKPFAGLFHAWQQWCAAPPATLAVLGGGAAAVELALALQRSLTDTRITLICADTLLATHGRGLRRLAQQLLIRRGVSVLENTRIARIEQGTLWAAGLRLSQVDAVVLATGAGPLSWYSSSGLALDETGFPLVSQMLQSVSHPQVFISGDACSLAGSKRSGVYSVRQGPVLAHNLPAMLQDKLLRRYHPQTLTLALLATADGGALLGYGRLSAGSALFRPFLGRWKDSLDLGFMQRHRMSA